jgi:hypothetical protein
MVMSLNIFHFNNVLHFWKRRKSLGNKSCESGGCGVRVILLLARNSCIDGAECAGVGNEVYGNMMQVQVLCQNALMAPK